MNRLFLAILFAAACLPAAAQTSFPTWLSRLPLFGASDEQVVDPFLANRNQTPDGVLQTSATLGANPVVSPTVGPTTAPADPFLQQASPLNQALTTGNAPIQLASLPERTVPPANELAGGGRPPLPPGAREGVFQKAFFTGTWLPPLSEEMDALGVGSLNVGATFGFPLLTREAPLLITPQFGSTFLDNAAGVDLPTTLYDAEVNFTHLRKIAGGPWAMNVGVTVGYYSDFDQDSSDAVRVSGRGLAVYETTTGNQWVLGVAYLNRAGATVLPVAGVILKPSEDIRWELTFPRPRVAWQTTDSVLNDQRWFYVGGELGGGAWSVTRPSTGMLDLVNYRDFRVLLGYERKLTGGLSRRFEFGYVFGREVQYDDGTPDVTLDDTLFVRTGLTY